MSSAAAGRTPAVRPRRTAGPTIAITGAATGPGNRVAALLAEDPGVRRVVAIDATRGDADAVTWRIADVTSPSLAGRLAGVDVLVHCATDTSLTTAPRARRQHNLRSAQAVLTGAAATGVRRVVLVTSAMVYGAVPDNPVPLDEDAPLRAAPDDTVVGDHLEVEHLVARARTAHPGVSVTVVRPAALVGPDVDTALTRHFEAPRLLTVRGGRPTWQFCHLDDLASALTFAAHGAGDGGVLTVGCEGWLEQEDVERLSGLRRLELPSTLAFGTAERLHRLHLTPAPASDLAYVVHPWAVSSTRLRAAGWRPTYDNETALGALLEQVSGHHAVAARRVGRKDAAALGATGAAVAAVGAVGAAAIVRVARKRRQG